MMGQGDELRFENGIGRIPTELPQRTQR